jgi:hypothetical protein
VVLVAASGCKADTAVNVSLHADGSGAVTVVVVLDAEAAAKVGDVSKVVSLHDLTKAGWTVKGPGPAPTVLAKLADSDLAGHPTAATPKSSVAIALTRPFADVAEANAILASLSGPDGPLRAVRVTRSSSFASDKLGATGTVDLSKGLDAMGDAALSKTLGGKSLNQLATDFNGGKAPADDAFAMAVTVRPEGFPMQVTKGGSTTTDGTVGVAAHLGDPPATFVAAGSKTRWMPLLLVGLAVIALLAAVGLTVVPLLPGRSEPPPPARKRQRHSATDAWEYVEGRGGAEPLDPRAAGKAHKSKRGRHARRRGSVPTWKADEITVDPVDHVRPRATDPGKPDEPV